MKKFLLAVAVLFVSVSGSAIGLEKLGIANHLGVDINAGTNGIGFEVSIPCYPLGSGSPGTFRDARLQVHHQCRR